ncbi:MAG: hypothetical protein SOZ52_01790, partial [Pyramidobacter sp.]|nr:hypothetical protein [Pyramidobacter sp.]
NVLPKTRGQITAELKAASCPLLYWRKLQGYAERQRGEKNVCPKFLKIRCSLIDDARFASLPQ